MINFYQWRSTCWIVCLIIVIRFAWKYQSRAEVHHEQLSRITETLIQTEVNFSRISRELKRARSKSRSRSRSMRSRRQRQAEARALSPRKEKRLFSYRVNEIFRWILVVTSPQRPLTVRDENKENLPKVPKVRSFFFSEFEGQNSVAESTDRRWRGWRDRGSGRPEQKASIQSSVKSVGCCKKDVLILHSEKKKKQSWI